MSNNLKAYRQRREALLTQITQELSCDERFLAAWLTGSYGRNDADEVSDLDIKVVVDKPYGELLCARQKQVSHKTTENGLRFLASLANLQSFTKTIITLRKMGHSLLCFMQALP